MPNARLELFELSLFIFIYVVIGKLAILPICISFLLQLVNELLCICDNVCELQKRVRLEEARRRRSEEISIISTAVSKRLERLTTNEVAKLEAARAEARKRHSEDVVTIASLIMTQVLAAQAKEKAKEKAKEESAKRSAQRRAERATAIERKRLEECLAALERDQRKTEKRERNAALDRERVALDLLQNTLPEELRVLDPLAAGFTCIGRRVDGGRCGQWMFSHDDLGSAAERLRIMRSKDPGNSFEKPQLLELANLMLCPRWHRDKKPQGKEIASKWFRQLQPAREALSDLNESRNIPVTPLKGLSGSFAFGSPASSSLSTTSRAGSLFSRTSMLQTPLSSPEQNSPSSVSSDTSDASERNELSDTIFGRVNLTSTFRGIANQGL